MKTYSTFKSGLLELLARVKMEEREKLTTTANIEKWIRREYKRTYGKKK
ncbi:MAG: hypothetical protein ABIJ16_09440 [Bacteroidota bacterium]